LKEVIESHDEDKGDIFNRLNKKRLNPERTGNTSLEAVIREDHNEVIEARNKRFKSG
jgi:hypothetical protein